MSRTITSGSITFMDLADNRKLDAYITSNLPITQIYNQNTKTYTPDWTTTNLQLSADIYLDSKEVTTNAYTSITWYKRVGTQAKTQVGTGASLIINSNQLTGNNTIITYICETTYNDTVTNPPTTHAEIVFTRVDTGLNGADGSDGTGVTILGSYNTVAELQAAHPTGNPGDAYIVDGNLYVWSIDASKWENVGNIQGPAGKDGEDAKSITLSGDSQVFKVSKTNVITPSTIKVTAQAFNTKITDWTYSEDGGQIFLSTVPTGVSRSGDTVTINGSTITSNSITIKASDGQIEDVFTVYKAIDGSDGEQGVPAPIAFLTNENITFSANAQGQVASTIITSNVVAYSGETKTLPTIGTITGAPTGMTITPSTITVDNEVRLTISISNNATLGSASNINGSINIQVLTPVETTLVLTWGKVNAGASAPSVRAQYSVTGTSNWVNTLDTATHRYIRFSYDGGTTWSAGIKMTGDNARNITLNADAQVFKINKSNVISPASITVTAQTFNTSVTEWTYSIDGGATFSSTIPTGIDRTNNTLTLTGANIEANSIVIKASDGTYGDTLTIYKVSDGTDGIKGDQGASAPIAFLTNENITFAANASGQVPGTTFTTKVVAYNGTTKVTPIIGTPSGLPTGVTYGGATTTSNELVLSFTISNNATLGVTSNTNGVINIPVTSPISTSLQLNWSKVNAGTSASLVDITPSALYFKSTTGKDGVFTPEFIYLYPRFQNATYNGWQYSLDGGMTWTAVTNTNGLSVGTYSSVANTLRVSRTSVLYTDTVTSISFRCNSLTSGVYDTVSIAKIYDVVDLEIGGRNLVLLSNTPVSSILYPINTYQMSEDWELGTTYTITIKGSVNSGQMFGIWANGSASRVATLTYDAAKDIHKATFTPTAITTQKPKTLHVYNAPSATATESSIEWIKLEKGNKATDWSPAPEDLKSITFQLYAPKGYLITHDVSEVTLQTFAYDGSQPITNATFKWYSWSGENWTAISNATSALLTVNKNNVLKSNVYKCEMTYGGKVYEATATVEDKTDIYESLIRVNAKRTSNNSMYWILYATVYSEEGERDALLGPVSETAPASPTTGEYWYQINPTNYSITLKKYSGTAWVTSTDKQELSYDWFLFRDTTEMVSLGDKSKIKIVKSGDFVTTCNVQCNVFDAENTVLSRNNQVLNDPTDPIVSDTAPTNPIDGQIWIKVGANGSYMLSVWSTELSKWILSNADTQNKVYVTKPTQYNAGDLWIVDSNYSPVAYENGVMKDYKHPEKTMLMATATSQTYSDAHWVEALKYQKELDGVIKDMEDFKQFISIDDTGLTMQAKGANGAVSEFKTMLTNTELGFYQGAARVAYINNNQLNISKAEITNGLVVSGTTPTLKIGNFTIIQESNGSLSIG